MSATPQQKRKLDDAGFEVANSEDEDYGWDNIDEDSMPNMPPQWQGSEDILVGQVDADGERLEASDNEAERETASPPSNHEDESNDG